jgi:photosystem II stability/assembly factor-like uncharacterized protein
MARARLRAAPGQIVLGFRGMRRSGEKRWRLPGGKAAARLAEFRLERGLTGESSVNATSTYFKAMQEKSRQMAALAGKPPQPRWSQLGPFSIPHGQTYGAARPAVSGRVSCIAVDPKAPAHILVGSGAGGAWQSRDEGLSWAPVSAANGEFPMSVGALAFVPGQSEIVYDGTGEGDSLSDYGVGLWKSSDGGTTWSVVVESPFVGLGFYALAIDPLDPRHMLAATTGGLFLSTDGGANWQRGKIGPADQPESTCWSVSIHPAVAGDANSTKELLAAAPGGLYRSADGGNTWNGVALETAPDRFRRLAVCHDPWRGEVAYAFGQDDNGLPALWRRDAPGDAFGRTFCPVGINLQQADYDWFAAVSPEDPNIVYLGAVSLWKGELRKDDTWNWVNISSRDRGDGIHADQHAIAFSPVQPSCIYAGNDGGIFKSPNGGVNWQSLNRGLSITQFEYLAQHPDYDAWLLGGTQDNGTLRYEGSEAWYQVAEGDGGECAINDFSPYTAYHCFYNMRLQRSITGGGAGWWGTISPPVDDNYGSLFYPPMEVNGNIVVMAGESCWVSTDTGSTFNEVSLPEDAGTATAIAIASPFRFYVSTASGDVYRFDWANDGWAAPATLLQARAGFISSIRTDKTRVGRLWLTYSDVQGPNVYRSDDGGERSWVACQSGLPWVSVNIVETDPANTDIAFAGTDAGVWRSDDAGGTWTVFSAGLPSAAVGDLAFHAKTRLLRAGTRSRGVWEVDLSGQAEPDPHVYLRRSVVDTGRNPCADGVADPFRAGGVASWRDSPDILIDSAPYRLPLPADVDFVAFEDARRWTHSAAHGPTRVYVQVHKRGSVAAANATVSLYMAEAGAVSIPALPAGFWGQFPQGGSLAGAAWNAIGGATAIANLRTGQAQVAAFQWDVTPTLAGKDVWLLALVTADNDKLSVSDLDLGVLIPKQVKCALKKVRISA